MNPTESTISERRAALTKRLRSLKRKRAKSLRLVDAEIQVVARALVGLEDEEDLQPGSAWLQIPENLKWFENAR